MQETIMTFFFVTAPFDFDASFRAHLYTRIWTIFDWKFPSSDRKYAYMSTKSLRQTQTQTDTHIHAHDKTTLHYTHSHTHTHTHAVTHTQ